MLRLLIIGNLQAIARAELEQFGFQGTELESVYRISISSFRKRLLAALEADFAEQVRRALARRGIGALVEVRGIKNRRNSLGELVQLESSAEGENAERIRLAAIQAAWEDYLSDAFRKYFEQNADWIIAIVRGQRRSEPDWDWLV